MMLQPMESKPPSKGQKVTAAACGVGGVLMLAAGIGLLLSWPVGLIVGGVLMALLGTMVWSAEAA